MVRFRTHGWFGKFNEGHGVIEAVYNGTVLNETHMGDGMRSYEASPIRVVVRKDLPNVVV